MKKLTPKEWMLLAILVFFIGIVAIKSFVFDPIKVTTLEEEQVVATMEEIIKTNHSNMLYQIGLIQTRVVAVKYEAEGHFKGRYRKYLVGVFPMGDVFFSSDQIRD